MTAPCTSPLLRLPLELRLSIYQFALSRGGEDLPSRNSLALLHTCRQVYIEARLIPFSGITVSLEPCYEYGYCTLLGLAAPAAVQLLRRLLPWQRRAVSLEVLSIFPCFDAQFASNWSTFCTLCNEAGLRLKALSVTACGEYRSSYGPTLERFPSTRFSELLLHPRLRVTYRCTKSARPLPDVWVEMLESMGAQPKVDAERESGGNITIKMLLGAWEMDDRPCQFLSAKGVPAEYPAWRSRYVQLVPEFKVLQTDW